MTILCYHTVDPHWESSLALAPAAFRDHCAWLRRRRTVLGLADVVGEVARSGRLKNGHVAMTFDDGLDGLYQHAFESLVRCNLPATIFLVAATLSGDGSKVDWIDGLEPGRLRPLTSDQVLEMQDAGIAFGSHSFAHRDLTTLSDRECQEDLRTSKEVLEDVLKRSVNLVAYPRGLHNSRVRRVARRVGFTHGFTTSRLRTTGDPLAIPRIGIYSRNHRMMLRLKTSSMYPQLRNSRMFPSVLPVNDAPSEDLAPTAQARLNPSGGRHTDG